jgi:hypothetical protein
MKTKPSLLFLCVLVLSAVWSRPASPASHQWRFNELYSNADGTIQFVEMHECCGFTAEIGLSSKWILVVGTGSKYTFNRNLTGNTADRYLLLATQGFADLPGVPAPDFIIPDGFLALGGDDLEYWLYDAANLTYGALPADGVMSFNADSGNAVNSPTNFAGETGSIDPTTVQPVSWGALKTLWSPW